MTKNSHHPLAPSVSDGILRSYRQSVTGLLWLVICVVGLGTFSGCRESTPINSKKIPQRIVSTVPSVTEVLFELGLGDRVIGVSKFCTYPEEVKKLPAVGGLYDLNVEQIIALEPDLIFMLKGKGGQAKNLQRLGLPVVAVEHRSIEGVIESFKTIGARCGVPEKGEQLAKELTARMERLRKKTAKLKKPRTLICVGRTLDTSRLEGLRVAGKNPFFNKALSVAGGENVMGDSLVYFPNISLEGILQTDPEVIFDILSPAAVSSEAKRKKLMNDWQSADVQAVRNGRVYLLGEDYALVPGPRFILFLEKLAELLHEK